MLTWAELSRSAPDLARFGAQRLTEQVMYLGTVRKDGYPRVHPFTPFVADGHLFAFMEPTSPKGRDLVRDGRYAIHSLVKDWNGSDGEFRVAGRAKLVEDPRVQAAAAKGCPYTPKDRYICFEFFIEECATTHYVDGEPRHERWAESSSKS